jgi:internalin A
MTRLTGLNLGQTDISDRGLVELKPLDRLKKLRLNDTHITDAAIATPAGLEALDELYVLRTDLTIEGVRRLNRLRPGCRIYYRSERDPE